MKVFKYGQDEIPKKKRAIALGFFDGVHLGHRALLSAAVSLGRKKGLTPSVFTFPSEDYSPKASSTLIYSTSEKLELFSELGIEEVILADFESVRGTEALDFITRVLIEELGCELGCLGYNYRFGKDRAGDKELFRSVMEKRGLDTYVEGEYRWGEDTLSSTAVRCALAAGEVKRANLMLGEPYRIRAKILHGNGIGHSLGFPTVNTEIPFGFPLKHGVYITAVKIGDELFPGITNVGTCPTLGERAAHAETHLTSFKGDLYGKDCTVYFLSFLREERQFRSAEELTKQIEADCERAKTEGEKLICQAFGQN